MTFLVTECWSTRMVRGKFPVRMHSFVNIFNIITQSLTFFFLKITHINSHFETNKKTVKEFWDVSYNLFKIIFIFQYPQRPSQSSTPVQSDGETNMGVSCQLFDLNLKIITVTHFLLTIITFITFNKICFILIWFVTLRLNYVNSGWSDEIHPIILKYWVRVQVS